MSSPATPSSRAAQTPEERAHNLVGHFYDMLCDFGTRGDVLTHFKKKIAAALDEHARDAVNAKLQAIEDECERRATIRQRQADEGPIDLSSRMQGGAAAFVEAKNFACSLKVEPPPQTKEEA